MSDRRRGPGSRVTPGDEIVQARRMALPSLDGGSDEQVPLSERRASVDPRRNDKHREIYEQGLEAGLAQGRREGAAEARQRCEDEARASAEAAGGFAAERLAAIVQSFETKFAEIEASLADKAIDLGVLIAGKVLVSELQTNRDVMSPVIQHCLNALGKESREATLRLHPDDFDVLDPAVVAQIEQWPVRIEVDPRLTPGDCMLETPQSIVDGSLETRWQRALAALGIEANDVPDLPS